MCIFFTIFYNIHRYSYLFYLDVCQESKKVETISSETQTLRGHCGPVYGTCFTPDGTVLLSASEDTSGKPVCRGTLGFGVLALFCLGFSEF